MFTLATGRGKKRDIVGGVVGVGVLVLVAVLSIFYLLIVTTGPVSSNIDRNWMTFLPIIGKFISI